MQLLKDLINQFGVANVTGSEHSQDVQTLLTQGYRLMTVPSASCGELTVLTK